MKAQEIFDRALQGVLNQGSPSMRHEFGEISRCSYRNAENKKCSIGHVWSGLIPDHCEIWDSGDSIDDLLSSTHKHTLDRLGLFEDYMSRQLLRYIQQAHDDAALSNPFNDARFIVMFKDLMRAVSENFDLQYNERKKETNELV